MRNVFFLAILLILMGCNETENRSDAYGNFEADPILISAEAKGRVLFLRAEEGQTVKKGTLIGLVDTTALHLQKKLVEAQIGTLPQKLRNALSEIEVLEKQKANLQREKTRVENLLTKKAATSKQLDDISGEIEVVDKKIASLQAQTQITNRAILAEKQPLLVQKAIIADQIRRSYIYSPVKGTVLSKLAEPSEIVGMGTPLLRVADLDTITLHFYVSGVQLQDLKLGQSIEVLIDEGATELRTLIGSISRIADQAEFTPKSIQTKVDRVNLVYAVQARVPNKEGLLKIGMPAEVNFKN